MRPLSLRKYSSPFDISFNIMVKLASITCSECDFEGFKNTFRYCGILRRFRLRVKISRLSFRLFRLAIMTPERYNSGLGGVRYAETHLKFRSMSANRWLTVVIASPLLCSPKIAIVKLSNGVVVIPVVSFCRHKFPSIWCILSVRSSIWLHFWLTLFNAAKHSLCFLYRLFCLSMDVWKMPRTIDGSKCSFSSRAFTRVSSAIT